MIALSPTMETGTLARWRKKEGDTVASGDVICEVETDKATMDYESSAEGTLLKILLPEGGQAKVGDLIAIVGKPGEDISAMLAGTARRADHGGGRRGSPGRRGPAGRRAVPRRRPRARRARARSGAGSSPPRWPAGLRRRRAWTCARCAARGPRAGS